MKKSSGVFSDFRIVISAQRARLPRWTAILWTACIAVLPFPARAEPVDHIIAAVNHEVITQSELNETVALNARLGGDGRDRKTIEAETLSGLITRRLLIQEARRLRFVEVSDQEVGAAVEKLKNRFGSGRAFADFLSGQNMTAQELERMVGEQLLVERFVEKKVGLFARVSREEAQSYYDKHASEYKGKSFPDMQNAIMAVLTDQKIDQQLDQYVAELRGKADIRTNPE